MHLVIDARMIDLSGVGRYLKGLIPLLVDKFQITLLGRRQEFVRFSWFDKVFIIECNVPIYSIREQFELPLKIPKCDIFWSPHYNIPILPIGAKKRIVTIHDVYHLAFRHILSLPQRIYAKLMINQAVKRSDIVLTDSEFSRQEIIKYTETSKDIKVVYIGIELQWYKKQPLSLSERDNYILYVGNVKPHKNLVRALKAFSLLEEKSLKFKIVGKKEGFITADRKVDEIAKKLGTRVEFTGYVSDDKLKQLYRKAKLFLFPSLYEGFGLPPLEAMACGAPVVVSNIASLPEVCGDAAYYVNPYDVKDIAKGIEIVLKDEELQKELIHKGLERAKLFSWEKSAKKLVKIIKEVI